MTYKKKDQLEEKKRRIEMSVTRDEHLEWCKKRALEYVERGDYTNAVKSMLSDLRKHPETAKLLNPFSALFGVTARSEEDARRFIEGFR